MLIFQVWAQIRGYVILRAEGPTLEKFINVASQRGIRLWRVIRVDADRLYLCTTPPGFKAMRKLGGLTGTRLHLVRREGLPFLLLNLERRKSLVLGAVLFLSALYVLSSFVWFIHVDGAAQVPPRRIQDTASKAGLRFGGWKSGLHLSGIERAILQEIPELAWVGIQLRGTLAVIKVVEKETAARERGKPAHVVASQDGLVTSVIALQGMALVKNGETVQKGDILISGLIPLDTAQQSLRDRTQADWQSMYLATDSSWAYVHADGVVEARVWYEAEKRVPLVEEVFQRTGRSTKGRGLVVNQRTFWLGPRPAAFVEEQEETASQRLLLNRKISLPVEFKTVTHYEVKPVTRYRTEKEAEDLALNRAMEELFRLTGGKVFRDRKIEVIPDKGGITVRVTVEVEEPIQEMRVFQQGEPPPPGLPVPGDRSVKQ